MSVARFFDRVHVAVGAYLLIGPDDLKALLGSAIVEVDCAPQSDLAAAWTGELLVNQLARLYPRLCISGDDAMAKRYAELARSINPSIELLGTGASATATAALGHSLRRGALSVGSSGWSACVGYTHERVPRPNVFAAGAAAAVAAWAIFRRVVLEQKDALEFELRWNLLSHDGAEDAGGDLGEVDVGRLLIAGVGAVGNSALWCLERSPSLRGDVWIYEPEQVDLSNLQRYVLALDGDVGNSKTVLAKRSLARHNVNVRTLNGRLGTRKAPRNIKNILVTVDNVDGRRTAQALLPRLVVNGWTSESGLGASWHDLQPGTACLACLYHPTGRTPNQTDLVAEALGLELRRAKELWFPGATVTADDARQIAQHLEEPEERIASWVGKPLSECYTNLVCGSAAVGVGKTDKAKVVPLVHQSVLAGVLAATELVKRVVPELREQASADNAVAWHDIARPPPTKWTQKHRSHQGCFCGDADYRAVHWSKWSQ